MMRSAGMWRLLAEARAANLRDAAEPAPVAGAEGATRRQVIAALAAATVAAGLPRQAEAAAVVAPAPTGPVAIVGGGLAGLAALWRLTHAGIDAHLWEARPRLGGRMLTLAVPGGEPIEMGAQFVNTDHHDMFELSRTFGVGLIDRKAGRYRTLVMDGATPVSDADAVDALRPLAQQMTRDADRLDRDYAGTAAELDRLSFTGYLDKHRVAVTRPWVRGLLEQTARTEYGVEPVQASAVELMFNLPSVDGARVDVLSRSDERWLIAGGSTALATAMAARMTRRISTGKRVTRIDPAPGGGVRLVFADGSHADAAAAIVATPASVTRRIAFGVPLPPLWKRFIAEVNLGRNEKVQAVYAARPWEAVLGRGGEAWRTDAHGHAQGWDGTVRPHAGGPAGGGVWTWYLGGAQVAAAAEGDAAAQARTFAAGLDDALPGMAAALHGARRTGWHRDPMTMGGYANFTPGQITRFASLLWVEERGRASPPLAAGAIQFAGEHLSDAYPGYMNGAAQTGRLAADAVMARIGRRSAA